MKRVKRHVRIPPRPEAVGEPKEVGLIDGTQQFGDRTLDDLILQRRHAEWSLSAIGFRDIDATHRFCSVAPGVDACAEVLEICLPSLLVHLNRYPVDSHTRLPLLAPECAFERYPINMMQQCSEPGLVGPTGRRIHPREVWQQDSPLNIAKRSLLRLMLSGVGLASKHAAG